MTYQTAYNKIIDAYFKDEIKPMDPKFCFCGTLCDNNDNWGCYTNKKEQTPNTNYTFAQFDAMENALFHNMEVPDEVSIYEFLKTPDGEEGLFRGMSAALDVLKSIHIERGEVIDETPVFTKRQLA